MTPHLKGVAGSFPTDDPIRISGCSIAKNGEIREKNPGRNRLKKVIWRQCRPSRKSLPKRAFGSGGGCR